MSADIPTAVMAIFSGGLGVTIVKAVMWFGDKNKREADVTDTYASTGNHLVKTVRDEYDRIRAEMAQVRIEAHEERVAAQQMRDVASAMRDENDDLRERVHALEQRENDRADDLRQLTLWAYQAIDLGSRHDPPLTLPPLPRSLLGPIEHRESQ